MGNQIQRPDKGTIRLIAMGAAPIAILLTLGVLGVFPSVVLIHQPTNSQCPAGPEALNILHMTFSGTAGQVNFTLSNGGTYPVTIVQAQAAGTGIASKVVVNISTNNTVPAGTSPADGPVSPGTLSLTVAFPGVTFQSGTTYTFTLFSACGHFFAFSTAA